MHSHTCIKCILGLRLHKDSNTHKLKLCPLSSCIHQHLNLYLLSAVILKETGLVSGQYTHKHNPSYTHKVHNDFRRGCVCLPFPARLYTQTDTHMRIRSSGGREREGFWDTLTPGAPDDRRKGQMDCMRLPHAHRDAHM